MKIYTKLLPFLKPHVGLLGVAAFCMLVSSLFKGVSLGMLVPLVDIVLLNRTVQLPPWVPGPVVGWIERFQAVDPAQRLHLLAIAMVVLFLLKNLVLFYQTYLMNDVSARFLRDVRNALYRQYHRLSLDFFSGERTGELVSRITYDVSVLQNTITEGITDLVYQTAQVAVFLGIVFSIQWKLAFVTLLLLPALGYPIVRIGKALRKLGFQVQDRMADLNSRLIETLQGIRVVKAFSAEEKEGARFAAINQQYYKANVKTVKRREALAGITDLISMAGGLIVLEVGGRAVLNGQLSPGTIVFFLAALLSLYQPVKRLSRLHSVNQQALTAAKRVVETLEIQPSVREEPGAFDLPGFKGEIRFEEVWFQYRPASQAPSSTFLTAPAASPEKSRASARGSFVLQGVDLTVRRGEVVAIAGSSGSGKTTLVNLLPRFYDPARGRVSIDGLDLRKVTLLSLRNQIGLVTQEPFLFHDTIRNNIAFGKPTASLEEVVRAAQAANADGFIRRLPQGYDTAVGELGARLSGGERQRIAIARALLKDPPILILDEATSQLDSESEALVQEALDRLMRGRTVFIISHRLSTIRNVDRIVVLDQGRATRSGRHQELMEASSVYRRLYELQVAP